MSAKVVERFEREAEDALARVEKIPCTIPVFIEGLTAMIGVFEIARDAAQECHEATGG